MSYFVVGVGGTGAKFVESMIHLSAAGLLPEMKGKLHCLLVDPDVSNGNVSTTRVLGGLYERCNRRRLQCGTTDLFRSEVRLMNDGTPWTPVSNPKVATLNTFFGFTQMRENEPVEADLMELLFSEEERTLPIYQGFRGRPAIGSTIFSKALHFKNGAWNELREEVRNAAADNKSVPVVLAGSVFGGSGAAGVPTISRLLGAELRKQTKNVRLGLVLFLPYFKFKQVPDEEMQADSAAFSVATSESLKYYDEGRFLDTCHSIYAIGDETLAEMRVAAVGAEKQRNDPHFIELVGGLAAAGFMGGATAESDDEEHTLSLAVRRENNTVRWADLPTARGQHDKQIRRLQQMTLFAVAFRYIFYPHIAEDLRSEKKRNNCVIAHIVRKGVSAETALTDLAAVGEYVDSFLNWMLQISTPAVQGFIPGLVKLDVFALPSEDGWRLKIPGINGKTGEFRDNDIEQLFLNADGKVKPRFKTIWQGAEKEVNDSGAAGTGRLVRAIYDACSLT